MVVSFWPLLLFTHSLLINNPIGWVYFLPFGATNSTSRSDLIMSGVSSAFSGVTMLLILDVVAVEKDDNSGREIDKSEPLLSRRLCAPSIVQRGCNSLLMQFDESAVRICNTDLYMARGNTGKKARRLII